MAKKLPDTTKELVQIGFDEYKVRKSKRDYIHEIRNKISALQTELKELENNQSDYFRLEAYNLLCDAIEERINEAEISADPVE